MSYGGSLPIATPPNPYPQAYDDDGRLIGLFDPKVQGSGPALGNLMAAMFGTSADTQSFGDFSSIGGLFGGTDPFAPMRSELETLIAGDGGIPDLPPEFDMGRFRAWHSLNQSDMGSAADTFNQWFQLGQEGGIMEELAKRMQGADSQFAERNDKGAVADVLSTSAGTGMQSMQKFLNNYENMKARIDSETGFDPDLDTPYGADGVIPGSAVSNYFVNKLGSGLYGTSASRDTGSELEEFIQAVGDQRTDTAMGDLGRQLIEGVSGINNAYERGLLDDIDTEAQRTLGLQMPEVQAQMEMAGLGRSGANQFNQGQLARDVLGQANRDKQRTMASLAESAAAREAAAFDRAAALGGQGIEGTASRMIGSMGQGFGSMADAIARDTGLKSQGYLDSMGLAGQLMGLASDRSKSQQQNLLSALLGFEDVRTRNLAAERQAQAQGLSQWGDIFGMRRADQQQALDRAMQMGMLEYENERARNLARQQAAFLPFQTMLTIGTGTTGGGFQATQQPRVPNPFLGALAGATGGVVRDLFGGGMNAAAMGIR